MSSLTVCKTCSKEVATTAKICPHCGAKLRMGLFSKIVLGVLAIVVVAAIAITLLLTVFQPTPEERAQKLAQQLHTLADMNPIGLDLESASLEGQIEANKGKAVVMEGTVSSVALRDGKYRVTSLLSGSGANLKGLEITLYPLDESDRQRIAALKTGEDLRVKGILSGMSLGSVVLEPAILASAQSSAAQAGSAATAGMDPASLAGHWKAVGSTEDENAEMDITNVTDKGFQVHVEALSGQNTGDIDVTATLNGQGATFHDQDADCDGKLVLQGADLVLTTGCKGGLNVSFDGTYRKTGPAAGPAKQ